ncbi:DUF2147 domain-containing protein [Salinarimonas soli]|uniref:DUF2147 domain-containing protein n=1 Tax=Salinarimonas soli TaxID=1638099 RepID=A0A5B2VB59_9HYPH|nr:DUF2147 domain-containing protein [Salinarimonas soli]KAA2235652.1 DUF2147 domain-containing protein [Salinarimonas soli]
MVRIIARPAAAFAALIALGTPSHAVEIAGDWVVADQTAVIRIAPCKDALCGTVVWTKTPGGIDEHNPDPSRRTQPVLGLEIIKTMKSAGPDRWQGSVYNAQDGRTYAATLSPQGPGALRIEGCILGGLLCGGETWTRAVDATGTTPAAPGKGRPGTPTTR